MKDDVISRQDVIEALICADENIGKNTCIGIIKRLPSAQPERPEQPESAKEYCAECDHIEMCRWYPYEGCEFRSLPSAQSEKKKGIWISKNLPICIGAKELVEVYICSNCGYVAAGDNVSNFCPVCGSDMRGDEE